MCLEQLECVGFTLEAHETSPHRRIHQHRGSPLVAILRNDSLGPIDPISIHHLYHQVDVEIGNISRYQESRLALGMATQKSVQANTKRRGRPFAPLRIDDGIHRIKVHFIENPLGMSTEHNGIGGGSPLHDMGDDVLQKGTPIMGDELHGSSVDEAAVSGQHDDGDLLHESQPRKPLGLIGHREADQGPEMAVAQWRVNNDVAHGAARLKHCLSRSVHDV